MALKIVVPLGTDRGITNEAYVRISDYSLSKNGGSANFRIEIYQSQDAATSSSGIPGMAYGQTARNIEIGEYLSVSFWKDVETTVTRTREVMVAGTSGSSGYSGTTTTEEYTETVVTPTIDLSPAEATNIFAFGYSKLKAKLQDLYGAGNIVDC